MLHLGDITKISGHDAPTVNVIIGGSPCQDLSIAGKGVGLSGERSGLFMEQLRIIKEMRENDACGKNGARPRFMVWENVVGAFSCHRGRDFATLVTETLKVSDPEIPAVQVPRKGWPTAGSFVGDGFSLAWRVLDSQYWGVPQRRRRIALVADFGGGAAPDILFKPKRVPSYLDTGKSKGESTPQKAKNGIGEAIPIDTFNATKLNSFGRDNGFGISDPGDPSYTIIASTVPAVGYEGKSGYIIRRLTPLECERLQGFPDGWTDIGDWVDSTGKKRKCSDSARYKALGNSIAIPPWLWVCDQIGQYLGEDKTMASLFDGIGGFPLIWSYLYGKDNVLWASEIDEFPIAVTKRRFPDDKEEQRRL